MYQRAFIVLLLVYFPTWVCSLSCTCYPLRQKWWNAFWAWNHIRYSLLRNPSIGAQAVFHEIEFHCYISVKVILKSPLMQRMQYYFRIFYFCFPRVLCYLKCFQNRLNVKLLLVQLFHGCTYTPAWQMHHGFQVTLESSLWQLLVQESAKVFKYFC